MPPCQLPCQQANYYPYLGMIRSIHLQLKKNQEVALIHEASEFGVAQLSRQHSRMGSEHSIFSVELMDLLLQCLILSDQLYLLHLQCSFFCVKADYLVMQVQMPLLV